MIERLPVGKYTLREETSPYGYTIANDIEFEVKDAEEIQKCQMKDEYVYGRLKIKKRDAELASLLLDGVTFEIRDADGKVLETLTTDQKGEAVSEEFPICTYKDGVYENDITYTVVETKTKDDYILDSTPHEVTFTYGRVLDKDGNPTETIDTDCKAPEVVEYVLDVTNKSTEPKLPQTGDDFNPIVWYALGTVMLVFAGLSIIYQVRAKKREDTESED